jgi:hypothetical protein
MLHTENLQLYSNPSILGNPIKPNPPYYLGTHPLEILLGISSWNSSLGNSASTLSFGTSLCNLCIRPTSCWDLKLLCKLCLIPTVGGVIIEFETYAYYLALGDLLTLSLGKLIKLLLGNLFLWTLHSALGLTLGLDFESYAYYLIGNILSDLSGGGALVERCLRTPLENHRSSLSRNVIFQWRLFGVSSFRHILLVTRAPLWVVSPYTSIRWDNVDYIVSNEESQILLAPKGRCLLHLALNVEVTLIQKGKGRLILLNWPPSNRNRMSGVRHIASPLTPHY